MKTIDELIKEGEEFRLQIKKKNMSNSGIVIVGSIRYFIPNEQLYYDWKTASYIFLKQNFESEFADEFKQLSDSNITPQNHARMLAILKALQNMNSVDSTYSKLDVEIMAVEKLRNDYEKECTSSVNSDACIRAFHKWYSAALVLFIRNVPANNSDLATFKALNKDMNGFNLRNQYYSIHSLYCILIDNIKHGCDMEVVEKERIYGNKIFIVHGHNDAMKYEVARVLDKLGLDSIILHEQVNAGRTIIEKLESNSSEAGFAVILLTADDEGKAKTEDGFKKRARQNVVFEMGLFMGQLGRDRVMLLIESDVEKPGDLDGLVYTDIDKGKAWKYALCDELKKIGFQVSRDNII